MPNDKVYLGTRILLIQLLRKKHLIIYTIRLL